MYAALFLFLIFYDFLEAYIPMMNYWDELATVLVVCWGGYSFWRNPKMDKGEPGNWIFLALLVAIGAMGNFFHPGLQPQTTALIKDVVALCKFPMIFFLLERRTVTEETREKNIACIAKISRWILVVTLFAAIVGYFIDLGFYDTVFRTKPAFKFVFSHQTFFVSAYVMIAAALMAESIRKNRVYLMLDFFLLLITQRSKAYIFIAFALLFILLGEERVAKILKMIFGTDTEKVKIGRLLLAAAALGIMILVVGKNRLEQTLNLSYPVPRTVLHVVGIRILVDFFPLGSGLGTFASHLSGRYYSNLYDMYGISNVIGMTREDYNYISDVFWPYIYGQFGIFGLLIYVKLILSIFFRQFRSGIPDASRVAMAAVWIYALIASTSEAYFTNGTGVQMALFLATFIGYGSLKKKAYTD